MNGVVRFRISRVEVLEGLSLIGMIMILVLDVVGDWLNRVD